MNLPDRHEIETALAAVRSQVAEHRRQLDRATNNRRHLYRRESVLRSLADQPDDSENVQRQLSETLAELDCYNAEIDAIENHIENLEAESLQHIECLEIRRRLPGVLRDLQTLWACRATRGRFAPSLPSYAGDLLREQLQDAGRKFQAGECDLSVVTGRLKRAYRI